MPERPFLTPPAEAGQTSGAGAPEALFDLAVNRAWSAAARVGLSGLAAWHARTRFARRVPLGAVLEALAHRPAAPGDWHWAGGPGGGWVPGKAPFP